MRFAFISGSSRTPSVHCVHAIGGGVTRAIELMKERKTDNYPTSDSLGVGESQPPCSIVAI